MAKRFRDLTEQEILALAITLEEEDGRIYSDFAEGLRDTYPATAQILEEMRAEEAQHRNRLIELHRQRFGEHIPLLRRQDVRGFVERRPVWLVRPLGLTAVRKQVEIMELETRRFYERAMERVTDASIRKLLGDLAEVEREHYNLAETLEEKHLTPEARKSEETSQRRRGGRGTRARGHQLYPPPLHGHAIPLRSVSGGRGWRCGLRGRDFDWKRLRESNHCVIGPLSH